jgi:hypothetical protein
MEPVKFSNRDAKLIRDNPGKSPYELKEMGLSNPGFEKLMSQPSTGIVIEADPALTEDDTQQAPVQTHSEAETPAVTFPPVADPVNISQAAVAPATPAVTVTEEGSTPAPVLIPKVTTLQEGNAPAVPTLQMPPTQVVVQTPYGKRTTMGREFAQKLVKQDNRYKIIG